MTEPNQAAPNATPAEPVLFGARNAQTEPRNWTPVIVGFVLMLAVVMAIVVLGRTRKDVVKTANPYAPNLVVEQARLSQEDNFVGATITYIDLTVKNNGGRTVVGGLVQRFSATAWDRPCNPRACRCAPWFRMGWAARTKRAIWRRRRVRPRRAFCG